MPPGVLSDKKLSKTGGDTMLISISDITVSAGRREAVPEDIRV